MPLFPPHASSSVGSTSITGKLNAHDSNKTGNPIFHQSATLMQFCNSQVWGHRSCNYGNLRSRPKFKQQIFTQMAVFRQRFSLSAQFPSVVVGRGQCFDLQVWCWDFWNGFILISNWFISPPFVRYVSYASVYGLHFIYIWYLIKSFLMMMSESNLQVGPRSTVCTGIQGFFPVERSLYYSSIWYLLQVSGARVPPQCVDILLISLMC